jgi:hypothetical protein
MRQKLRSGNIRLRSRRRNELKIQDTTTEGSASGSPTEQRAQVY